MSGVAKISVRARAVDLLGRQQVAGIPTAISELFKNAHDAYAKRVEVDFYRPNRLFILRDDGIGMGRVDFERRWLTIGTESKAEGKGMAAPPVDPDQPVRSIMGEKGIGRLAIALIGPQVLVLSRPKLTRPEHTVASFINWSVFSLPGIDLSEIEVPILELPRATIPSKSDIDGMIDSVRSNVEILCKGDPQARLRILAELDQFQVDPAKVAARLPSGPDIREQHGTQFWIQAASDLLAEDIDGPRNADKATPMEKVLLGFSNTMTPAHEPPPVVARFRDHLGGGIFEERIGEQNFFTPDEFLTADHHIEGQFDNRGQFSGSIKVYGREAIPFEVRWPKEDFEETACGPIRINFAYVQGAFRESRLPRSDWQAITAKLNRIGGLYIYRDGIRILPYGDSDYDFLDIENRRTRSAGYYFFSYRRLFGMVEITRRENSNLVEKAGREGFQQNKAYRQFRNILENFFIQVAAEFFRDAGVSADTFVEEKSRLTREKELIEKRRKQISGKREQLKADLDDFFEAINDRRLEVGVAEIVRVTEREFSTAGERKLSVEALAAFIRDARSRINEISDVSTVRRPRGVGLTRELSRVWTRYEIERDRLGRDVFLPGIAALERMASEAAQRGDLRFDTRRMVIEVLEDIGHSERRRTRSLQSSVQKNLGDLRERALLLAREGLQTVDKAIKNTLIQFEHVDDHELSPENLHRTRERLEREIVEPAEQQIELLQRLRDQLKAAATLEALEGEDVLQAMEGELEERRERDLESLQLAQMGMAVGIVHHEFHAVIRSVRQNVRRLKPWADSNEAIQGLYDDIERSYTHLDSYLSLFAPLNRRLNQTRAIIEGSHIFSYLRQLLGDRLRRHEIELDPTADFLNAEVTEYVSTLYPPFVNLVDNAIHWLGSADLVSRKGKTVDKRITLDFAHGEFLISDTGPGVLPVDRDAIFESGFSRKPGGSGLGLYITKELLGKAGYELRLDPYEQGTGATFRIITPPGVIVDDGDPNDSEEIA